MKERIKLIENCFNIKLINIHIYDKDYQSIFCDSNIHILFDVEFLVWLKDVK